MPVRFASLSLLPSPLAGEGRGEKEGFQSLSAEMLAHQSAEVVEMAHLMHAVAERLEIGQEAGEVAARSRQPAQADRRAIEAELVLDQPQQLPAALGRRRHRREAGTLPQGAS